MATTLASPQAEFQSLNRDRGLSNHDWATIEGYNKRFQSLNRDRGLSNIVRISLGDLVKVFQSLNRDRGLSNGRLSGGVRSDIAVSIPQSG